MKPTTTTMAILFLVNTASFAQTFDSLWTRSFGGTSIEWGYAVGARSDGNLLLVGSTGSFGAGGYDGYLMCVDGTGNDVWVPLYYGGAFDEQFFDIAVLPNNDFYTAGEKEVSESNANGWVMKFSAAGSPVYAWQGGTTATESFNKVVTTPDGGCIVCGTEGNAGAEKIYIAKFTANLDTQWTRILQSPYRASGNFIKASPDGNYIFGGSNETSANHFVLGKLASSGDSLWMYQYAGLGQSGAIDALLEQDRIVVAGYTSTSSSFGQEKAYSNYSRWIHYWCAHRSADLSGTAYEILPCGENRYVVSGIMATFDAPYQSSLTMLDEDFHQVSEEVFQGLYFSSGACIRQASPFQVAVAGTVDPWEAAVMLVNTDCFTSSTEPNELPTAIDISVYPNPFNALTTIQFSLQRPGFSSVKVFDVLGKEAAILHEGVIGAGAHELAWEALQFGTGAYFVQIVADGVTNTRRIVLLK